MKQITIVSGKGGTGKTTITAAFASLAKNAILADCDCDAPDLQLILTPEILDRESYIGTAKAIRTKECSMCGICDDVCRFNAIDENYEVKEAKCEGCGTCVIACPENAIELRERKTGDVFESKTRFGPIVHAELEIGEEATGKMVNQVRQKTQKIAGKEDIILIDGSPGIGCPVIASIKGVDLVVVISEPTVSGIHDLKRVLKVANHFGVKSTVCINKSDINSEKVKEIRNYCESINIPILGELPYDDAAIHAMIEEKTVTEYSDSELARSIKNTWGKIEKILNIPE